jgi:hypothetical protein
MKPQLRLAGAMLLVWSSPESRRFSSSGLNLTSEWLLLGASLCIPVEGTHSYPCQSGFWILNLLHHVGEELVVVFCKEPKVPRASTRRIRRIDCAKVGVGMWAEAKNRRWHASHQPKVAGGPLIQATHGSILLAC